MRTVTPLWRLPSGAARATTSGWVTRRSPPTRSSCVRPLTGHWRRNRPAWRSCCACWNRTASPFTGAEKNISIGAEGWGNNVRFDRLGDGYTLDDLLAVLSGQKEHMPRKQAVPQAAPPKVNLLVDIQAKLQAGKGAGYARWAKVFNLKQMAQTLNYLSEHGLLDYADLETKTAEATARYNALSDQIKAAEKRMAEIAVLRTHIVNYAKTRETYVAYRKAGYSKKFRQEHEEEILLHQAAKEAFNELNVKKLPTIKELQTEYAQLLADKKKAYGEYRQARATMRELLTVKNNVDRVLAMEQTEPQQKEKDHGQR